MSESQADMPGLAMAAACSGARFSGMGMHFPGTTTVCSAMVPYGLRAARQ